MKQRSSLRSMSLPLACTRGICRERAGACWMPAPRSVYVALAADDPNGSPVVCASPGVVVCAGIERLHMRCTGQEPVVLHMAKASGCCESGFVDSGGGRRDIGARGIQRASTGLRLRPVDTPGRGRKGRMKIWWQAGCEAELMASSVGCRIPQRIPESTTRRAGGLGDIE